MRRAAVIPVVGKADLSAWRLRATPGDRFAYWRGHLAIDAFLLTSELHGVDRVSLSAVAALAWTMERKGWVHLLQQRHGDRDFTYLAVARPLTRLQHQDLSLTLAGDAA